MSKREQRIAQNIDLAQNLDKMFIDPKGMHSSQSVARRDAERERKYEQNIRDGQEKLKGNK